MHQLRRRGASANRVRGVQVLRPDFKQKMQCVPVPRSKEEPVNGDERGEDGKLRLENQWDAQFEHISDTGRYRVEEGRRAGERGV